MTAAHVRRVAVPGHAVPVRYTRHHVEGILQLMGCKTLHAVRLAGALSPPAPPPPAGVEADGTDEEHACAQKTPTARSGRHGRGRA